MAAASLATAASATFVEFYTVKTSTTSGGVALDVYVLYARFNGPTDTVLNAFDFNRLDGADTNLFYHKDNSDYNGGVLQKTYGTWSPQLTGNATLNRPFDSFLTIGGSATATNTTNSDVSWPAAGGGWNRPDVPNGLNVGWFNSSPPNFQGRVGVGTGAAANPADSVRLGQFVVDAGANGGTWNLQIGYNSGVAGAPVQFATSTFTLAAPCSVWYRDIDGDGLGSAADGTLHACTPPSGYSLINGDNCPTIANPNQADANGNGIGDACEFARGDLNLDGVVNASDIPLFFNLWGTTGSSPADFDFDGVVNSSDFTILLNNWGTTA